MYSQDIRETLENITEKIKEGEEEHLILGDCNARTGCKGGPLGIGDRKEEEERKSIKLLTKKEEYWRKLGERGWRS